MHDALADAGEGAKEAELPPLQLYTAPPTPAPAASKEEDKPAKKEVGPVSTAPRVAMETSMGKVVIELNQEKAPITVRRHIKQFVSSMN